MGRPDYDPNPISPNPDPLTPGRVGSGLAGRDPSATPNLVKLLQYQAGFNFNVKAFYSLSFSVKTFYI